MQNISNIHTTSIIAPPSYAEATGLSAPTTNSLMFHQRYSDAIVYPQSSAPFPNPYSSCHLNMPVQSIYGSAEQNHPSQPTNVSHGTLRIATTENKSQCRCIMVFKLLWVACTLTIIVFILMMIIKGAQR